jgi:hypothetical protein
MTLKPIILQITAIKQVKSLSEYIKLSMICSDFLIGNNNENTEDLYDLEDDLLKYFLR